MSIIKAGYRLNVTSWENDADHYADHTLDGLSLEKVKLLVDLALLLKSESNNRPNCFGNMYDPNKDKLAKFLAALKSVVQQHPPEAWPEDIAEALETNDDDMFSDVINDVIHDMFGASEDYHTRVYSSHIVEYIPEQIEIKDVTDILDTL